MLQLQEEVNVALEQLLTTRATMDSHQRDLALNANTARCVNEAWATEALKEAEVHYAATIKEAEVCQEGQDHQVFLEACGAVLWACPPKAFGVLMYPLQLLTGSMSLAAILGMASYHPTTSYSRQGTDINSLPTYSVRDATPNQNQMAAPLT